MENLSGQKVGGLTQVKAFRPEPGYAGSMMTVRWQSQLMEFGARAAEAGLVSATCGNASLRVGPNSFLISATGSELSRLTEMELSEVTLSGEMVRGAPPSCELPMHLAVYRDRPEAQAVLHTHSPWATLMACLKEPLLDLDFTVEVQLLVGQHAYVPFHPPGSDRLAEEVARAFRDPSVTLVQLRNHGQVALGSTWKQALHRLIVFERACWMALQARELGMLIERIQLPRTRPTSPV